MREEGGRGGRIKMKGMVSCMSKSMGVRNGENGSMHEYNYLSTFRVLCGKGKGGETDCARLGPE